MSELRLDKNAIIGLFVLVVAFFLAMAQMDFQVMHMTYEPSNPEYLYKYWISLGLVVTVFATGLTWVAYSLNVNQKYLPAIFITVWLLFIGGLLDLFYGSLAYLRGEPYSFEYWSAQYKWFVLTGIMQEWTLTHQLLWFGACLLVIGIMWKKVLKR